MSIIGGSCLKKGGFKPSAYYDIEWLKGGSWSPELLGVPTLEWEADLKRGSHTPLHTTHLIVLHITE